MLSLGKVINSVLKGTYNFCCLCYNNILQDCYNVHDIITVQSNIIDEKLTVFGILQSLFSETINANILEFKNVCHDCLQSAINSYIFIQNCKANSVLLTNAIEGLTSGLEYTKTDEMKSKTLYIVYDTENNYTKHIYDNNEVKTAKMAEKRIQILNKPKIQLPIPVKIEKETIKHEKISLKDMLHDPNDKSTLRCKWCLKIFPKKWVLRNHYLKTHASKEYKCTQCPLTFCSRLFLKTHEDSHTKFSCSKCGKIYKNRRSLNLHERGHSVTLVCPDCGRVYHSKRNYQIHIDLNVCKRESRANPSDAKYTCDYCNKKYTQKVTLRVHIQFEHGNFYKAHICEFCGKRFWAPSRLKAHIVTHTKEKKFTCSICNGKFVTKEALLYHTRLHTGEKPYKCAHCNLSFLSASRRSMHTKKYHAGACLQCDLCSCSFTSRIYLEKHRKCHFSDTQLTYNSERNSFKNQGGLRKDFTDIPLTDLIYQLSDNVSNDNIVLT